MNDAPSPAETPPPDPAETRAERRLRMLAELAEMGMEMARALHRRVCEPAAGDDEAARTGELGLAYSRVSRAVRLTLALEARFEQDRQARDAQSAAAAAARREAEEAEAGRKSLRGHLRKYMVRNAIAQAIEAETAEHGHENEADRLHIDLRERLDAERDIAFADRPIGELVALICRDLGLTPDWSLWDDQDWAIQEGRTRRSNSPFDAARPPAHRLTAGAFAAPEPAFAARNRQPP